MTELIITNGDSAAELMRESGMKADILPWRDVLHEGPVPETSLTGADGLKQLSVVRANFLADTFDMPEETPSQSLKERDDQLCNHSHYDQVTLWFEHDLYDQLQLLQILSFFHNEDHSVSLLLVQADDYLGRQTPETIGRFEAMKAPVSREQARLAADIFHAFRQPAPTDLATFLKQDLSALPFMRQAITRLFEELPSTRNGLSRTQEQALIMIERHNLPPGRLFGAVQATEEAMFMGDVSFFHGLEELAFNDVPLIHGLPSRFKMSASEEERRSYLTASLTLTDAGRAVLSGKVDHAGINVIDRWLGGTHITGDMIWRWDRDAEDLVSPTHQ